MAELKNNALTCCFKHRKALSETREKIRGFTVTTQKPNSSSPSGEAPPLHVQWRQGKTSQAVHQEHVDLLGVFAELRKATSYPRQVCPSAWDNSSPTCRILIKFDYFSKICSENSSCKNNGCSAWRPTCIYNIWLNSSYNEKCLRQKLQRNQNTHFKQNNTPPPPKVVLFMRWCRKMLSSRTGHS
jgi:hypothetical protein